MFVKVFENTPILIDIDYDNISNKNIYYFKAIDINKIVNVENLSNLYNFTIRKSDDIHSKFLTYESVYQLLYSSNKDLAEKFRTWVNDFNDFNINEKEKQQEFTEKFTRWQHELSQKQERERGRSPTKKKKRLF